MVKSKNSKHSSHLVTEEEENKLAANRGAIIAVKALAEYMSLHKEGILQIFREFDTSRDGLLQSKEIEQGLRKLNIPVTKSQISALLSFLDQSNNGEVDLAELDECIKQYRRVKKLGNLEELIADHSNDPLDSVFPNWLIHRKDFQLVFNRFQEGELDESEQVIKSFQVDKENRTHEDLQLISQWLEKNEVLPGLGARRMVDVARTVYFEEVDKGHFLCTQGEIGDAFYIVYSGSVRVLVNGTHVDELQPGHSFGERALETDEPRSATCIASEKSQLVVIKSHEYKLMMKMHQQKKFKQAMNFLQVDCKGVRSWTYPKIFKLSAVLVRRVFKTGDMIVKQGEESSCMYLLFKGSVNVQKEVTYVTENRWPDVNKEYTVVKHEKMVALHLTDLVAGDHFGEEMILGYNERQYSVVAKEKTEVFVINRSDVLNFFRGNQIVSETRLETSQLYESADEIKQRHEERTRLTALYKEIKQSAFGTKYRKRAGLNRKKRVKRQDNNSLEATLQKLNQQSWEKSVRGKEGDNLDVTEGGAGGMVTDMSSIASRVSLGGGSIESSSTTFTSTPVLRSSMSVRRESLAERQSLMSTSKSLPSLSKPGGGKYDGLARLRAQADAKSSEDARKRDAEEKEAAKRRRGNKSFKAARLNPL
jgi:cAMP-dependent protein kinase regulator